MSAQEIIVKAIEEASSHLTEISLQIHDHPELRFQERFASALLCGELETRDVPVERGVGGFETAFRARVGRSPRPAVAILAEYDALPEIGHACGHNLICCGALGAFLGLAALEAQLPGTVAIIGTPGEEGGGGKIKLMEAGVFQNVDAAMMFHPFHQTLLYMPALASNWIELTFYGKASHAAAAPWEGSSALSGVIQTFNLIDNARLHFKDGTRIHGFITQGGQAVNVIPDKAQAMFSVRTPTSEYLEQVMERVLKCADAAALATNTRLEKRILPGYKSLRNNLTMARRFGKYLEDLGVTEIKETDPHEGSGSTDMGDISQILPSMHPYIAICDPVTTCHQLGFAAAAATDRAFRAMLHAAKAMALTAYDLLTQPELLKQVKEEFRQGRGQ